MAAYASFAILINTYHLIIVIGTRHFSRPLIISYCISYLIYVAVMITDEFLKSSSFYMNILDTVIGSFTVPFSITLGTLMIALPIYGLKCWEMVLRAPRFY